jgi:hypothetical protein
MATPVNKRQFGTDAVGAPLSFNQLDSNFAYFENMAIGEPGCIPVIVGGNTPRSVPGFTNLEYAAGKAQASSSIRQFGGNGISQAGIPLLEASASLTVLYTGSFVGPLLASGGLFTTQVSASGITASGVLLQKLVAPEITGSLTGSIVGFLTGSMSGSFVGSASGYFSGQVDGTSSFTTAPIQTILQNGNVATQSLTLVGGTLRVGTPTIAANLVVAGTASLGGQLTTENTLLGNNNTDVHYVSGAWQIYAPLGGMNVTNGTNLAIGNGTTTIRGTVSLSSSLQVSGATTLNNSLQVTNTNTTVLGGTLSVGGNTTLTGSLQVSGSSVFNEDVTISNNHQLVVGGTTTVGGATSLSGSLQVSGATTFNSNVTVSNTNTFTVGTGATTLNGATQVNNTIGTTGIFTSTNSTNATATSNGSIVTAGGVGIAQALWVGGLSNIAGALTVGGATQLNNTLGATGIVSLTSNTSATSTTTGTLVVTGGTGISQNLWVGGTLNVAGAVSLGTITGTLVNALTVDDSTLQYTAGTTYDNSTARTIRIKDLGVVTAKIADLNVTTAKIADLNVTNAKIADGTIANAKLANNTISGKALGTNLDALTIGTGLSGTSYNGSAAVTIANTGVTSNVAGTNITVSGATGAVTINVANAPTFSGNVTAAGFFQSSKRSLKTSIIDFEKDALDIIKRTKIVEFYYLSDLGNKHIGFIADDTPEELATKNHDTMDTNSTLAVALKAIQQLEARVIELEKQLSSK